MAHQRQAPSATDGGVVVPVGPPTSDAGQPELLADQRPAGKRAPRGPPRRPVLDPAGSLHAHWSLVVSLAFLYNFWALSYRFAFSEIDQDSVYLWLPMDLCADLVNLLDLLVEHRTGYLEEGVLERNLDKIGQHYRDSITFYLDCLALLPLDILYVSIGFNSILRFTRLVKIYKFWAYLDRRERHTNYPNVFRTFTLVHYTLVIFHWNACLFHMISTSHILDIESLYQIKENNCTDVVCEYLSAFYWSTLSLSMVGDLPRPRTKGELLYVSLELFFGLFLFASVLGHVANIVANVSAARKEFQAKLDAVKTFMRMRRVSEQLQGKVISWFDYLWMSQQSSDEERSVACLPDKLKAELAIHVHLDTLRRVEIFQNTEAGFLCELVLRLKPVLFSPGDFVCRKNEVGHEMYIVSRGILQVVAEDKPGQPVLATLKAGTYFGEISVLNVGLAGNKRTASVRSVGYSDLFCLNKQDLWDVLRNYPNAEARIRARAEERLSKLAGQQPLAPGQPEPQPPGAPQLAQPVELAPRDGATGGHQCHESLCHEGAGRAPRSHLHHLHHHRHHRHEEPQMMLVDLRGAPRCSRRCGQCGAGGEPAYFRSAHWSPKRRAHLASSGWLCGAHSARHVHQHLHRHRQVSHHRLRPRRRPQSPASPAELVGERLQATPESRSGGHTYSGGRRSGSGRCSDSSN